MSARSYALIGGCVGLLFIAVFIFSIASDPIMPWRNAQTTRDFLTMIGGDPGARRLYMVLTFIASSLGFLGIIWAYALFHLMEDERPSLALILGRHFATIGFAFLSAMIIVQGCVKAGIAVRMAAKEGAEREALFAMLGPLRLVDFGLDLTWDIFVMIAMLLIGWAMIRSRYFGRILGYSGIAVTLLLLVTNIWQAPIPPNPDFKPLAFVWIIAVSVQMLRVARRLGGARLSIAAGKASL